MGCTMSPQLRLLLVSLACAALAVWLGVKIAEGSFFWPGVAAAAAIGAASVRLLRLPLDAILCGWLLIGYIAGNRGFAQLMPAPGIPLLPAEGVLLIAGGWRLVAAGFERRLPFVRDPLNLAILVWLVAGGARLLFDTPAHGFLAIRDSAMVYYAIFFFLAQEIGRDRVARNYLAACAVIGCLLLLPLFALNQAFPDVFIHHLTVHGVPVIHFKGDLLFTFFAIGSLLVFFAAPARFALPLRLLAVGMFLFVAGGDNRASAVGLVGACAALVLARRWTYPAWQATAAGVALVLVFGLATVANNSWAEQKLHGMTDRVRSLTDLQGLARYQSAESFNKGDNNRFRLVWWMNVVTDTWNRSPVFGLGFGADLAAGFLQEYYPEADEEFSARSPHNFFLSVFGRMGFAGLGVWLVVCLCMARRGWHVLRREHDPGAWGLWCSLLVLLVSATFGVVLEGPMGAVPFWILLGLAHARQRAREVEAVPTESAATAATVTREPAPVGA
jgi:hypothetical protein